MQASKKNVFFSQRCGELGLCQPSSDIKGGVAKKVWEHWSTYNTNVKIMLE